VRSVLRAPRSTALFKIPTQVNDSARKIRVMSTAAKEGTFSASSDPCVFFPLAARGVYPKTRVWGSKPENLHCFSATAPLKVELRWGCEDSSEKTAVGSGVSFKYDPFGRRIYKSSSSGTSVYAYDGSDIVEETNSSGSVVARYAQGENIDEPLAMLLAGTASYYHADGLGSVTSLSNSAGALAQTYGYDSFGKQLSSTGSLTNPFLYTGREFDAETSLYFNRSRYYDPAAGRFLGEDPLGFGGDGANFYAYVGNSPTGFTDLFGLSMDAAKSGLCEISNKKFSGPCRKFLEKLANLAGISVDALISQLQATASDAQNYLYDGPSSTVPLDGNKFPGVSSPGVNTVGDTFSNVPNQEALSQFNGSAIFLKGDWGSGFLTGLFSPYATSGGSATSYGLGTLTHELLHKKSVGGGFSHSNMNAALNAVGAAGGTFGRNDISDRIARLCFSGSSK